MREIDLKDHLAYTSPAKPGQKFSYCIQRADGSFEEGEAVVQADGKTIVRTLVTTDATDARPSGRWTRRTAR